MSQQVARGNMSLTAYFGGGPSNKVVVIRKAVSDSGGFSPVHRGASLLDTALHQVKEKKRPQGGLTILFGSSSTQYPLVEKNPANSNDSEEFQEQDVWASCIEDSSPLVLETTVLETLPVLKAPSGIFLQTLAPVNIPGRWNNVPNMMEAPELGDAEWIPPHVYLRRKRHAYTGLPWSFSIHQGSGRVLKGRDAREFRNAVLRMTGFIET